MNSKILNATQGWGYTSRIMTKLNSVSGRSSHQQHFSCFFCCCLDQRFFFFFFFLFIFFPPNLLSVLPRLLPLHSLGLSVLPAAARWVNAAGSRLRRRPGAPGALGGIAPKSTPAFPAGTARRSSTGRCVCERRAPGRARRLRVKAQPAHRKELPFQSTADALMFMCDGYLCFPFNWEITGDGGKEQYSTFW